VSFIAVNRVLEREPLDGENMTEPNEIIDGNLWRLGGKMARTRKMSTNLTPDEERQILVAATAHGKPLSEWVREVLLDGAVAANRGEMEMHIFTELVGIEVLLMNALEPLLRGNTMAQDQLTILFRQVQSTKASQAQELLARRSQNKEK
jgi:hypothetical protein